MTYNTWLDMQLDKWAADHPIANRVVRAMIWNQYRRPGTAWPEKGSLAFRMLEQSAREYLRKELGLLSEREYDAGRRLPI